MEDYKVVRYSSLNYIEWNDFVFNAKNATFLFHRDFMEYHQDRFEDFSLLIYQKEKLIAILPANKVGIEVYSHQGLSYGGLILLKHIKFNAVINILYSLIRFLKGMGIENLILKKVPSIYESFFTQEVDYLMFVLKAELVKRDTLSVIKLADKLKISSNRLEGCKRGKKHQLIIKEEDEFELFWNEILIKNLKNKYNVEPVHTSIEMALLKKYFPNNIRQFNVYHQNKIVAGTTIFESKYVAHSQYISGDKNKNVLGSLDFLHIHLINEIFKNKRYFDFGNSNENNGLQINKGMQFWKEGFGARTLIQDFYKVKIENYQLLNNVFV